MTTRNNASTAVGIFRTAGRIQCLLGSSSNRFHRQRLPADVDPSRLYNAIADLCLAAVASLLRIGERVAIDGVGEVIESK